MEDQSQAGPDQVSGILKLWFDSLNKLGQAAFAFSPDAVPPEMLRQVRAGIFQALSQSWDEFLRSPQFMEAMKQMMENAIAFRKVSTDLLTKARHDLAGVAQEDVDGAVIVLQRLERRILERLEGMSGQISTLNDRLAALEARRPASQPTPAPPKKRPRQPANRVRQRTRAKT